MFEDKSPAKLYGVSFSGGIFVIIIMLM